MASNQVPITVAHGDGIGPEIMAACLHIMKEAGAGIQEETIEIGEKVYLRGISGGIEPSAWESLRRTKVFFKAPITTPQGGGFKSMNVTTRKTLGLYANVRPCVSYHPYVQTKHPNMNVVIVRENEEDLYAGIEHRQTDEVYQCLKLISRPGSEKIVRYAFEYARRNNRKKVTCFTKDNIMKFTDGLFHKVFDEIGAEYPEFEKEHWIVDIGAAKLADTPEAFDVIVMPNLYGDILSDVSAQIAGSVGLAGSANIGEGAAMFEAIHGSAPRRAGQNMANPSGLLHGGLLMLVHIGQPEIAEKIHNAWLRTLEEGIHTYDIFKEGTSQQKVGTKEFAEAVVARLGQKPQNLKEASYSKEPVKKQDHSAAATKTSDKQLVGVDVFFHWKQRNAKEFGKKLDGFNGEGLKFTSLSNRGVKVYPDGFEETFCTDHWRAGFMSDKAGSPITHAQIVGLLGRFQKADLDFIKIENLYTFDGQKRVRHIAGRMTDGLAPLVGVIMGSKSDWDTMKLTSETLRQLDVPHECRVVSAHRTPDWMAQYAKEAAGRGIEVIIAAAGGAAHLPGMVAAHTSLPVLGVPMKSSLLHGVDSLLSMVQMPAGIPVGTLAIGPAGATNAALLAASILGTQHPAIRGRLEEWRRQQTATVLDNNFL